MNSKSALLLLVLIAFLPLTSCSGQHSKCTTNCTSGNATVTITLWDTPPLGVNLLSFTLPIAGVSLTPSSGSSENLTTTTSSFEATRLQTDSVLLVDGQTVPLGTYTAVNVTLGPTTATSNVFINASGSTITWTSGSGGSCANGAVCFLPAGAVATITLPVSLTLTSGQNQWIGLNLNLNAAITTSKGLSVDFTQSNVLTATTTTRTGIPSGSADTIEDFVGVVTAYAAGSSITVQNGITGQKLTAVLNSSTGYDVPPNGAAYTGCSSNVVSCLKVGSTVSIDADVSASGVLTATEVDFLDTTAVDEVEGIVYPTSTTNVWGMILADKVSASGNSVLGASTTTWGSGIFLNVGAVSTFSVDTKTLTSAIGTPVGFSGIGDLLAGQQIRVQVSNVTSASTGITATANNMLLRFSRLSGIPSTVGNTFFNFAPPSYITVLNPSLTTAPLAYTYTSTLYDGVSSTSSIANSPTVSIRVLFLHNNQPTFAAAKVRVP